MAEKGHALVVYNTTDKGSPIKWFKFIIFILFNTSISGKNQLKIKNLVNHKHL